MTTPRYGPLEIDEDLDFQRRSWRVQRLGWAGMALFVAAALAGLLGGGPLATGEVTSEAGGLTVRYPRFARRTAPVVVEAEMGPQAVRDGRVRLWFSREFLEDAGARDMRPPAEEVLLGPDRVTYVLRVSGPGNGTRVRLEIEPRGLFRVPGRAGLDGGPAVAWMTFVYP